MVIEMSVYLQRTDAVRTTRIVKVDLQ